MHIWPDFMQQMHKVQGSPRYALWEYLHDELALTPLDIPLDSLQEKRNLAEVRRSDFTH